MRVRLAITGTHFINCAVVLLEKRAGTLLEDQQFLLFLLKYLEVSGGKGFYRYAEVPGQPSGVGHGQRGIEFAAAVGTLGTVHFPGYLPIGRLNGLINGFDGEGQLSHIHAKIFILRLAEFPQPLDCFNVRDHFHFKKWWR